MPTFPVGTPDPPASSSLLASVSDLETLLKRTFSPAEAAAATLILAGVSGAIRRCTGQTLSLVEGDSITIDREPWRLTLWLPQRPVVSVASIAVDGTLVDADRYRVDNELGEVTFSSVIGSMGSRTAFDPRVVVVYSHGFDPVGDDVVTICLNAAARAFYNPEGSISPADGSGGFTAGRNLAGLLTKDEKDQLVRTYRTTGVA